MPCLKNTLNKAAQTDITTLGRLSGNVRPKNEQIYMTQEHLDLVRSRARQKLLFLPHAIRQMNHPDRMISTSEVRRIIFEGEIIEDYPEDARGYSCLMLGAGDMGRVLHIVCAPKDEYLAIVTAYVPNEEQWENRFTVRRMQ